MTNLEKLLAKVRELDDGSTEFPFFTVWGGDDERGLKRIENAGKIFGMNSGYMQPRDANAFALARTLLPKLAEIVEVLRGNDGHENCWCQICNRLRRAEEIAGRE